MTQPTSPYHRARVYQDDARRELQSVVDRLSADQPLRRVLDAGCGYELPLDFPPSVELVGLDESAEAMAKNENIDAAIIGDLETARLDEGSFDAVLCWTVLEHLERPQEALRNLVRALRPGGLLIVGVPNIWSIKGLITKATPHRFHVWAYRRLLGHADAGNAGVAPYRTYLRLAISPRALARFARASNLELLYANAYGETPGQLPRLLRGAWTGAARALSGLLLGKVDPNASEYAAVFRKLA
jgi:SAM-dependent methyltransferase